MFQVLQEFGPPEAFQTGELCIMMDKFFDCCNVRNTFEWKHKRKEYMKPYSSVSDERCEFLKNVIMIL